MYDHWMTARFNRVINGHGQDINIKAILLEIGCNFRRKRQAVADHFWIGMTKLGGYLRCLSVMASTIPKSRNIALATIFPPIVLGIAPLAVRPSSVSQLYCSTSSDFLTETVTGTVASHDPRLFDRVHLPLAPSLSESAMGVLASSVRVAQPATIKTSGTENKIFLIGRGGGKKTTRTSSRQAKNERIHGALRWSWILSSGSRSCRDGHQTMDI